MLDSKWHVFCRFVSEDPPPFDFMAEVVHMSTDVCEIRESVRAPNVLSIVPR